MNSKIFDERFFNVYGETLDLQLINTYTPENGDLPFYWWRIVLKNGVSVGKISLRLGQNYHSHYNGNIGYEVDEAYRGNGYAFSAGKMVVNIARQHGMRSLFLACDYDNVASYKTIEKLGAVLVEEVVPPKEYLYYFDGIAKQKIYELKL